MGESACLRAFSLHLPYILLFALVLQLRISWGDEISYALLFAPLFGLQFSSTVPSLQVLMRRNNASIVSATYRRIVARKTVYNAFLRSIFLILLCGKLEVSQRSKRADGLRAEGTVEDPAETGAGTGLVTPQSQQNNLDLQFRVICIPIWLQLLVVIVMLHTEVRRLQDENCERAFKKQSANIEIQLLASLFIAMKADGVLSWSWMAVFWPLWIPAGILCVVALVLSCFMPCMLCVVMCSGQSRIRSSGLTQPALMAATWISCLFTSVCSCVFLIRLGQYLDGDISVQVVDFMVPLILMLSYLMILEVYITFFGLDAVRRLAVQQQQMLSASNGAAQESAEDVEAHTNSVMNGEKPKLLIRMGEDLYRRPREDENITIPEDITPGPYVIVVGEKVAEKQPCVVCWEKDRETVLLECGHSCCCFECARRIILGRQPCPMCRTPIQQCVLIDPSGDSNVPAIEKDKIEPDNGHTAPETSEAAKPGAAAASLSDELGSEEAEDGIPTGTTESPAEPEVPDSDGLDAAGPGTEREEEQSEDTTEYPTETTVPNADCFEQTSSSKNVQDSGDVSVHIDSPISKQE